MSNKTDRREDIRRKRKLKWLHHGIGAHTSSFIHLRKKKGKK